MNKVICDVCGTAFPETASQCPICGSAKVSSQAAAAESGSQETTAYAYVKGGRFSKKNVRNRNRGGKFQESSSRNTKPDDEEKTSKGLVAVVIILLIAIVAVVVYIGLQFFDFDGTENPDSTGQTDTTQESTDATQESTEGLLPAGIACEKLHLSNETLEFLAAGDKWTLEVEKEPADSTDAVQFTSGDPNVATVSETGEVVAVSGGTTTITVTCGSVVVECQVRCDFGGGATTDPSDPSDPVDPSFVFEFNTPYVDSHTGYADSTFDQKGYTWRAYKSSLSVEPSDITWSSDDPNVCTVADGIVTMVGPGKTLIHAQYQGQTFTCIVRCVFSEDTTDPTEGGDTTDPSEGEGETASYTISHQDVTLNIGADETFWLRLKDADGNNVDVTWTADKEGYVLIEGNKITGVKNTSDLSMKYVLVSTTVDGVTYSCKVRVN